MRVTLAGVIVGAALLYGVQYFTGMGVPHRKVKAAG